MPGYGKGPEMHGKGPHMESVKQERKNLMDDNPVARTAAGDRPWIAKHYKSGMNYGSPMKDKHSAMNMDSPMKDKHSAMKMDSPMNSGHSPMEKHTKAQEKGLNPGLVSAIHLHDEFTKKNNIKHK